MHIYDNALAGASEIRVAALARHCAEASLSEESLRAVAIELAQSLAKVASQRDLAIGQRDRFAKLITKLRRENRRLARLAGVTP